MEYELNWMGKFSVFLLTINWNFMFPLIINVDNRQCCDFANSRNHGCLPIMF